jgi:hypothetical protein
MNAQISNLSTRPTTEEKVIRWNWLYTLGGVAALTAMFVNLSDIFLGFGSSEFVTYGSKSAVDWFATFQESSFEGLYALGIFNIAYMLAMLPVYFAIPWAHRRQQAVQSALVLVIFLLATAIYLSTNAAIPMLVLAEKYSLAQTEVQKTMFAAAGEAILARGEDFTPGAFLGFFLSSIAALAMSFVMLRGGIFGRWNVWIGILGFTFLLLFTIIATFVPSLYTFAFYFLGSLGGILALTWFALTARRLFQLGSKEEE